MDTIKANIKVNFLASIKIFSFKLIYFRAIKKIIFLNLNLIYYFMTILKFRDPLDGIKNILNLRFLAPSTITLYFKNAVLLSSLYKKA
tara:strand:+ start:95 stop:358 length:264 start_codon:yes stop_codon:yes gene_type:complete